MRLIAAQVGAGKTDAVQRAILQLKARDPLARVWVLLATERQIVDFRRRFMAGRDTPIFNVEYFSFYQLYRRLLAMAGKPQRCLDDAARLPLLRDLVTTSGGRFAQAAGQRGMVGIIGGFIDELKQNLIAPDRFAQAASTPKEHELATIYADYQRLLQRHDLVDGEGEGWVALDTLEENPRIVASVDLLVVDGYDQFNLLQARLLAALSARIETLVTLTDVPERGSTIGRRFTQARARLEHESLRRGVALRVENATTADDDRPPALLHLLDHLLRPNAPTISAGSAITLIEAPDVASESADALRHVKRLLLNGSQPDDIMIAVRDWGLYGGHFAALRRVYDLPLALHYGESCTHNPAVIAVRALLDLHARNFRRRDLLDVLASPYLRVPGIPVAAMDTLERIAADQLVTGGREAWIGALELAAQPPPDLAPRDDEDDQPAPRATEHAAALITPLVRFFDAVTPPPDGTLEDYAAWIDALTGVDQPDPDAEPDADTPASYTLDLPGAIRAHHATDARDAAALQVIKYGLSAAITADALSAHLNPDHTPLRGWHAFTRELDAIIASGATERGMGRDGRVLVTSVTNARGLPHRHVIIVGMAEGVFPTPTPEDPLLLDSERERLRADGIPLLTQAERAADDGLFYGLIGQAHESLTLTRPTYKDGDAWAASHLWRAVMTCFDDLQPITRRLGEVPAYDDALTPAEAALAVSAALSKNASRRGMGWLSATQSAYWSRIKDARAVELRRLSRAPHDHYTGRLSDPALIDAIRADHDARKVWSASALNAYGMCGYRYFAQRLLNLEAIHDPEEGMDQRQLGTIYHELLETVYRAIMDAGLSITPDNLPTARAIFDQHADTLIASAPARLRFRPSSLWEQEAETLKRRILRLIESDFNGDNPINKVMGGERQTAHLEAHFGMGDAPPITIDLAAAQRLRVRGAIDRIDQAGDRVVIIDYKSGSTAINADEIRRGRNVQMLVYLEAARALLPNANIAGGVFWSVGQNKSIGTITAEHADAITAGKAQIARHLERIRAGDFAAEANKPQDGKCASYCDFAQLCRIQVTRRGKP